MGGHSYLLCVTLMFQTARNFSKRYLSSPLNPKAVSERFESILEQQIDQSTALQLKNNPELQNILERYQTGGEAQFNSKYQDKIGYLNLEKVLNTNKHARDLADPLISPPWTGKESVFDSSLRMIIDTKPKPMKITPRKLIKDRIHSALEGALDYKLAKVSVEKEKTPEEIENDNFRELYKERLMGPSMFLGSSGVSPMGLSSSMADVRINERIDKETGHFKLEEMGSVRGQPLDREHLANATDTNYFLNRMLQKQECVPPWVEAQQGVNKDIERFRHQLDQEWAVKLMHKLTHEFTIVLDDQEVRDLQSKGVAVDQSYHKAKLELLKPTIKDINLRITTYNLSSPSLSFHKWKLVAEDELNQLYKRVLQNLGHLMNEHRKRLINKSTPVQDIKQKGFLSLMKDMFL